MTRSTLKRCVTASVIAIGAFFLGTNWLAYPVSARGELLPLKNRRSRRSKTSKRSTAFPSPSWLRS